LVIRPVVAPRIPGRPRLSASSCCLQFQKTVARTYLALTDGDSSSLPREFFRASFFSFRSITPSLRSAIIDNRRLAIQTKLLDAPYAIANCRRKSRKHYRNVGNVISRRDFPRVKIKGTFTRSNQKTRNTRMNSALPLHTASEISLARNAQQQRTHMVYRVTRPPSLPVAEETLGRCCPFDLMKLCRVSFPEAVSNRSRTYPIAIHHE